MLLPSVGLVSPGRYTSKPAQVCQAHQPGTQMRCKLVARPCALPVTRAKAYHVLRPRLGPRHAMFGSQASTAAPTDSHWWKKDADLWVEVHDAAGFQKEVLNSSEAVVVDWYASWCQGCMKSYPEVCDVLKGNPDLRKSFKFVKICIDDFPKSFSREQGISALPRMSLYRPGQGKVITWDIPVSRVKHLKKNLTTIIANPNSALVLDPNSFIMPNGPAKTLEETKKAEAAKAQAVADLEKGSQSLFERLQAATRQATGPASPASPAAAPATNGNGVSGAAVAVAGPSHVEAFKAQYGQAFVQERLAFLHKAGHEYGYGGRIDELYPREVGVRMAPIGPNQRQQHYMDYTGSSVYCQSQLEAAFKELSSTMFGNPHAQNPSSELSSQRIDEVRNMILSFFNADPAEWQLVFTRSATGALKMVGETFPWSQGSLFRYLRENHNSVLGIRALALQAGAAFQAFDDMLVEEWLRAAPPPEIDTGLPPACRHDHVPGNCTGINNQGDCDATELWANEAAAAAGQQNGSTDTPPGSSTSSTGGTSSTGVSVGVQTGGVAQDVTYSLFAFPAEDNFAGVKYPLSWAADIKRRSTATHKWMVLIDAAAYVPTQPLDLSQVKADFVDLAFYKMFGYPTGLGALLVRTEAVDVLRKVFWGGGSVALATSKDNFHVLKCRPSDKLEDGTVSFLDIISLKHGFNMISQLGGINSIQSHVACLTEWLYEAVSKLRHSNGRPVLKVFGKHSKLNHRQVQGGILNFELLSPQGVALSYRTFEREAAAAGFHVRTGAECNPGACYAYLGVSESEIEGLAGKKEGCDDGVEFLTVQRPAGGTGNRLVTSEDTLRLLSSAQNLALGHPAEVASKWVQVPLGSVRVSLGWMSTFEDCYALVDFISNTYKDREAPAVTEAEAVA